MYKAPINGFLRKPLTTTLLMVFILSNLLLGTTTSLAQGLFSSPPVYVGPIPNSDFKFGRVMARAIVIDPATGEPILVRFNEDGSEAGVIDLGSQSLTEVGIFAAEDYRFFELQLEAYNTQYEDTLAKGAELLSRRDYEARDFKAADNVTDIIKPMLPPGVNSVLVRTQVRRLPQAAAASLILLSFPFDLSQNTSISTSSVSILVNTDGQVIEQSDKRIGYRNGFFGDPNDAQDARRYQVENSDQVFGPVQSAKVYVDEIAYRGGVDVSDEEGQYSFRFYMPLCPLGGFTFNTDVSTDLFYKNFLPTGSPTLPYHVRTPGYSYCFAQLAPSFLVPELIAIQATQASFRRQSNLIVDVMFLTGRINIANINGEPVPIGDTTYTEFEEEAEKTLQRFYDFNRDGRNDYVVQGKVEERESAAGERFSVFVADANGDKQGIFFDGAQNDARDFPDLVRVIDYELRSNESIGVLKNISANDMRNTDILIFRDSTGQLVMERRGLKEDESEDRAAIQYDADNNEVGYRVMLRGLNDSSLNIGGTLIRSSYEDWATENQLTEPFQTRESDQLRPGESVKIVAINRATGYMATAKANLRSATNGVADLTVAVPQMTLRPPNLKIWAEREYTVEKGLTQDEERQYLIGSEGAALTSDTLIRVYSEWLDEYGYPLPRELGLDDGEEYGLTGRLAKVAAQNTLNGINAGNDLAEFAIKPGRETQVIRVASNLSQAEHFYIHVIGKGKDQECVNGSSCPSFNATGSGLYASRPALLTPFRVPLFDENSTWLEYRSYRSVLDDFGQEDSVIDERPEEPLPSYVWQYRPEYQFSQYQLEVEEINRQVDNERSNEPDIIDIIDADDPLIASNDELLSILYSLVSSQFERLDPIDGEQESVLAVGEEEQLITIGDDQTITFENLAGLGFLDPEDFLTIRLYANNDAGNTLWEYAFELANDIGFSRRISLGKFNSNQTSSGTLADITDSFLKLPFAVSAASAVDITLLDENRRTLGTLVPRENLEAGRYGFIVTYEDVNRLFNQNQQQNFYISVNKINNLDGKLTRTYYVGDITDIVDSEMLGNVIEHDTLIQRGSLTLRREDINLRGVGPQLNFSRSYSNETKQENEKSTLGPGWSHNHDISLSIVAKVSTDGDLGLYGNNLPTWIRDFRTGERPEIHPIDDFPTEVDIPRLISVSNGGLFVSINGQWVPSRGFHGSLRLVGGHYYEYIAKDGTRYEFEPNTFENRASNRRVVERIIDRNDNTLSYEYGEYLSRKQVEKVTDASGRTLQFNYFLPESSRNYRLQSVISPVTGIDLNFQYSSASENELFDPLGGALLEFSRDSFTESYTYQRADDDNIANLVSVTDAVGNQTQYNYLAASQVPAELLEFADGISKTDVISQVDYPDDLGTATIEYIFGAGNQRRVSDLNGNLKTYTLNQFGNPSKLEEPLGKVSEWVWTIDEGLDDVLISRHTDAEGREYTYEYDQQGNVIRSTDPIGTVTQSWNQQFSLLLERKDRNGNIQRQQYDAKGNLSSETDAEGFSSQHTYAANGLHLTTRHPSNGGTTSYSYDQYGNLASKTLAAGSVYTYENDARGNVTKQTDANGNVSRYTYDELDILLSTSHPDGFISSYVYDEKRRKISEQDKLGLTLNYSYDARDRITLVRRSFGGGAQTFAYDNHGNLLSETDWKGQSTTHNYDALHRRISSTNRVGDSMSMAYDLVNNLLSETDYRGLTTTHRYDNGYRRTSTNNRLGDVMAYTYDNENNVLTETDYAGRLTRYGYDKRYLRTQRINAVTDVATWNYDGRQNLIEFNDEEGRTNQYSYDRQNRQIQSIDALGYVTSTEYDGNSNPIKINNRRGFDISQTYDEIDRLTTVIDADGFTTRYSYDANNNRTSLIDGNNHITGYEYDQLNRLLVETTPVGGSISHSYDENNNLLVSNDALGTRYTRSYDPLDRLLTEVQGEGSAVSRQRSMNYDPNSNLLSESNFRGFNTAFAYDNLDRLVSKTDALGQRTQYSYDAVDNKLSQTNRRGFTSTFQYDNLNRVTLLTDALGQTIASTYDGVDNLLTLTDKRGTITTNTYDQLNRLLTSIKPDGNGNDVRIVKNEYDGEGNIIAITDANDNRTQYQFNGRNLQIGLTHPDNNTTSMVYDGAGNSTRVTDEIDQVTVFTFDEANRKTSATNAANETTRYEYDLNNNKTQVRQPKGNTTQYAYDALNRLVQATDGENNVTRYTWDGNDNQLTHQDANGNVVSYVYDELDRRTEHNQPNGLQSRFSYDPEANMTGRIDQNGQTFSYAFDALDRKTQQLFPAVVSPYLQIQSIDIAYDGNNNHTQVTENKFNVLTNAVQSDISLKNFDLLDRQTRDEQRGHVIDYGYDNNGNRISVSSAGGSTTYAFDSRNRLLSATTGNGTSTYTYTGDSKQQQIVYPNGTITQYAYDLADRMTSVVNAPLTANGEPSTSVISRFSYQYDDNSNRVQQIEQQNGFSNRQTQTTNYVYDNTNRLTQYTISDAQSNSQQRFVYTYDNNYNRITEREIQLENLNSASATTTVIKDRRSSFDANNRLTQIVDELGPDNHSIDYTYDSNGNTLRKTDSIKATPETTEFVYDSRNQLVKVSRGPPTADGSLDASNAAQDQGLYDYNYDGMRIRHLGSERGDVEYLYDGKSILEERTINGTAQGSLLAHYRYSDRLISLNTQNDEQYYHYSALKSTANLTNNQGQIQASYRTDAWGKITQEQGDSSNRQVFTGQEHDQNTGLIYFGARFYDPETGRFLNEDTYLGDSLTPPSLHRYLYAYGNPTVYIDLNGNASHFYTAREIDDFGYQLYKDGKKGQAMAVAIVGAAYKLADGLSFGSIDTANEAITQNDNLGDAAKQFGTEYKKVAEEIVEDYATEGAIVATVGVAAKVACGKAKGVCDAAVDVAKKAKKKLDTDVKDLAKKKKTQSTETASTTAENPEGATGGSSQSKQAVKQESADKKTANSEGCPCCFVGETLVVTKEGLKPISKLQEGDLVASRNDKTDEIDWKPITTRFVNDDDRLTYRLTLVDEHGQQETYELTENHPFYVEEEGWVDAIDLTTEMKVRSYQGNALTVVSIVALNQSPVTYNIEVDEFHTYFVGNQGAWVHNMCSCTTSTEVPKEGEVNHQTGTQNGDTIVVDSNGTAINRDPNKARQDLENAGFEGRPNQTRENGSIHTVPKEASGKEVDMDIRIMDGQNPAGQYKGPRAVTQNSDTGEFVKTDGSKFKNNESKSQRKHESHLPLEPQ